MHFVFLNKMEYISLRASLGGFFQQKKILLCPTCKQRVANLQGHRTRGDS